MKNIILLILGLIVAFPISAQEIGLIKGSGDAVYYKSGNGKRYVFPNEKVYFSWYSDFSSVETISDSELALIPIGGNVTYKPGVRLLKITSVPVTYAVEGLNLRPITSESVAASLYGLEWSKLVDDLPEAFFVNYGVGLPINSSADYVPSNSNIETLLNKEPVVLLTEPVKPMFTEPVITEQVPISTPEPISTPVIEEPMPTSPNVNVTYQVLPNDTFDAAIRFEMTIDGKVRTDLTEKNPLSISKLSYMLGVEPSKDAILIIKNASWGLTPETDDRKILYEGVLKEGGTIELMSPILAWPGHNSFELTIRDKGVSRSSQFTITEMTVTPGSKHEGKNIVL